MYEFKWLNYHYRLFTHPRYTIRSVTETFAINYSIICCDMWHLIFVIAYVLDVKFSPNGKYFPHTFWVEKIDNAIFWCVVPGYTRLLGNEAQVCTSEKAIMTFAKLMSYVLWCIWVYPASLGLEADIIFQQLFFICIFLSFFFFIQQNIFLRCHFFLPVFLFRFHCPAIGNIIFIRFLYSSTWLIPVHAYNHLYT